LQLEDGVAKKRLEKEQAMAKAVADAKSEKVVLWEECERDK
jgi:hypothetical protein